MAFTINIYYTGTNGSARKFAEEMINSGIVDEIRSKKGNLRYEYFCPINYYTGQKNITEKTYTIHHYAASWVNQQESVSLIGRIWKFLGLPNTEIRKHFLR